MSYETEFKFDNLAEKAIELAEEAIKSNKLMPIEKNDMLSISYRDYDYADLAYKNIIKESTPVTSYSIFGGNALGMQSYGLYKARDGKVYIIDAFLGELRRVFIPDKNIDCFKDLID
jgi:hypothetical protein